MRGVRCWAWLAVLLAGALPGLGRAPVAVQAPPPGQPDPPRPRRLELRVQEFYVEHEISEPAAREAARDLSDDWGQSRLGCEECTRREREYCAGTQVISDHCCCDKKFTEAFPYVPHTCFLGEEACVPVATDCSQYARLRTCCCDAPLGQKWKAQLTGASSSSRSFTHYSVLLAAISSIIFFFTINS